MKADYEKLMNAIAQTDYDRSYVYDTQTGDITEKAESMDGDGRYINLPDAYEIDNEQIMKEFIYELPEGTMQDSIYRSIRGRGMFSSFREAVTAYDMENGWFNFRNEAYEKIALKWCEKNKITPVKG